MKTLKTVFAVSLIFGLVGCSRGITSEEIKNAEQICGKNGGMRKYYITGFPYFNLSQIICNDGMRMADAQRYKTAN